MRIKTFFVLALVAMAFILLVYGLNLNTPLLGVEQPDQKMVKYKTVEELPNKLEVKPGSQVWSCQYPITISYWYDFGKQFMPYKSVPQDYFIKISRSCQITLNDPSPVAIMLGRTDLKSIIVNVKQPAKAH